MRNHDGEGDSADAEENAKKGRIDHIPTNLITRFARNTVINLIHEPPSEEIVRGFENEYRIRRGE